jgi:hypothetical protein
MVASINCLSNAVGMTSDNGTGRRRGSIRQRGGSLQVRVFARQDPVTQRERYLSETVKGTDRKAHRKAAKVLTRLQAAADRNRVPDTSVPLRRALSEWLGAAELEDTTRRTYTGHGDHPDAGGAGQESPHTVAGGRAHRAAQGVDRSPNARRPRCSALNAR